MAGHN